MEKPHFFTVDGEISPDGQKVIDYLEARGQSAGNNAEMLNALPGYVKHYHLNVMRFHESTNGKLGMAPAEWLKSFAQSGAMAAWYDLREVEQQEAQRQQVQETVDQTTVLSQQLEELKEQLAKVVGQLDEKKAEADDEPQAQPKPARKRKTRKATVTEAEVAADVETETETDVEDDEAETETDDQDEAKDASEEA